MPGKLMPTNEAHEIAYTDLCRLLDKYAGRLSAYEMLAVAANLVGKLVAMQDQRCTTPQMAMELIAKNIEYGNAQVIGELAKKPAGGRA